MLRLALALALGFVVPLQFDYAENFIDGLARVKFNEKDWGYNDRTGRRVWSDTG